MRKLRSVQFQAPRLKAQAFYLRRKMRLSEIFEIAGSCYVRFNGSRQRLTVRRFESEQRDIGISNVQFAAENVGSFVGHKRSEIGLEPGGGCFELEVVIF